MGDQETKKEAFDLEVIRERLAAGEIREFWRSLSELAETKEFLEILRHEFPHETSWVKSISRREFLKLLAAPLALAGLTACLPQPEERIVPYVEAPEELVPGEPLFFATAMELDGYARGLLVENRMGRPVKVEGNPLHPASLGATDAYSQASILSLYDPERAQVVTSAGLIRTWEAFQGVIASAMESQRNVGGAGLRLLTGTVTSPTLAAQLRALLELFPQAGWHQYDPVGQDNRKAGAVQAFGESVETIYRFDAANVILSLEDNFLFQGPGNLRYMREYASRRQPQSEETEMCRLYVVESLMTNTGASADHRLRMQAGQVEPFARALAARLGISIEAGEIPWVPAEWMDQLVADLESQRGSSLILAGPQQPPAVHALAHALNQALGNVGRTVFFTRPVEANPVDQGASLRQLVEDLQAGEVEVLVIMSDNPAYASPGDLNFAEAMTRAGLSVYWGLYSDETARLSHWHIPAAHYLEAWSDSRAYDGAATIIQPLIEPLYRGRSRHELLAELLGQQGANGYDIVRQFWQNQYSSAVSQAGNTGEDFEQFWRLALRDGVIPDTAASRLDDLSVQSNIADLLGAGGGSNQSNALEIIFEPDPSIWDGRFFHNAWLQELPKPVTKLTWDNAALVSPGTALSLDITNEEVVELLYQGRSVRAPVWITPGLPDNSVVVQLGYGQRVLQEDSHPRGFNAYTLRPSDRPWFGYGLEIRKTGQSYALANTQDHHSMEGRDLVRVAALSEFRENPNFAHESDHLSELPGQRPEEGIENGGESEVVPEPPSIYPEFQYDGYAWGMAINLNSCTGCNACVIACQAENNIPVVGKEEVLNGREMHWLRIDRYFEGSLENPDTHFEPVLCMHCEKAPCEPVCPVAATVHNSEGLNEQVYNRCIGTRYCSHNCPYKVRRFNFYQYAEEDVIPLKLLHNPEVTIRSRGVMEKCTYCVQRINSARIKAKVQGKTIEEGEVVTACQQACPTQAIVFGNINDPESQVRRLKELPLNYGLLEELGTQPRTTYLAKVRNPNPEIGAE